MIPTNEKTDSVPPPDDPRVVKAMEEYVSALESGARLNREDFLARHAEIRDPLATCLEGFHIIRNALRQLSCTDPT
jgi:hypothetical protein